MNSRCPRVARARTLALLAALATAALLAWAQAPAEPFEPPTPPSMTARKVYEQARSQLVQIRTVLKGRASQTSVGSGFFVTTDGHIVTNFHVVSDAALKPERHDLVYVTADGREAPVAILQIDVLHDLALLRPATPTAGASMRWRSAPRPARFRRVSASILSATRWMWALQ
jgi:serine protease Do